MAKILVVDDEKLIVKGIRFSLVHGSDAGKDKSRCKKGG